MDIQDYFSVKVPRQNSRIGQGGSATVHAIDNKTVVKMLPYWDNGYMTYLKNIVDIPNKHFPKIYDISSVYSNKHANYVTLVTMERLSAHPDNKNICFKNYPLFKQVFEVCMTEELFLKRHIKKCMCLKGMKN